MLRTLKRRSCLGAAALAAVVLSAAACSPKREAAAEKAVEKAAATGEAKSEAGGPSALNPKATIDHVQKRLDEAAAKDAQRREQIEAATK